MGNTEQAVLVAEHLKMMTYRELYDLSEALHEGVKAWHEDGDEVSPDDFAKTLLGWAESVPSNDK
jgi:hypothetical protein